MTSRDQQDAAESAWLGACGALGVRREDAARSFSQLTRASPAPAPDIWHTLAHCVNYQAGIWQSLLDKGMQDVTQPAAFKLAIVLRHTPTDVTFKLLGEILREHSHCRDLTSYILALLTEDEACPPDSPGSPSCPPPVGPAPPRDLQLFGDCELAVLAANTDVYDKHAKLVRAEYPKLAEKSYCELRIKVLNQFSQIPKLYHTAEFEDFETAARDNIHREISMLKQQLQG